MIPYGSKRTHAKCTTSLTKPGGKIHIRESVKNPRRDRPTHRDLEIFHGGLEYWRND